MKIKEKLQAICQYFQKNRRVGHTRTMLRGAESSLDCVVIAADYNHALNLFRKNPKLRIMTLERADHLIGMKSPIVFDNFALMDLARQSWNEITWLESDKYFLDKLAFWHKLAFDNEEKFKQKFCQKACEITKLSWDSENMRIVYILDCGQHVSNSFKMEEWLEFKKEIENEKRNLQ